MPVYVYRRRDGSTFELKQRITVDALVIRPTTGRAVERVMQRSARATTRQRLEAFRTFSGPKAPRRLTQSRATIGAPQLIQRATSPADPGSATQRSNVS
jgi:hypothetical protein